MKKYRFRFLRPFITWKCNYRCEYCTLDFNKEWPDKSLFVSGDKWIKFLNSINGMTRTIFSGGEPTLHPDFVEIINGLEQYHNVWIYTNLSKIALKKLLTLINKQRIHLYVSYHKSQADKGFWGRYEVAKEYFPIVAPHQPIYKNEKHDDRAIPHRIVGYDVDGSFYHGDSEEDRFRGGQLRSVLCDLDNFPIAPDGIIYSCNEDAYRRTNPIGNVFEGFDITMLPMQVRCDHYGLCNPCEYGKSVGFIC